MKAFQDCKYTKAEAEALAKEHFESDQFIKGTYGKTENGIFKGCSVGCMAGGKHEKYPELFGIDPRIAYLSDAIFEELPKPEHEIWTVQLFEVIPESCNTTKVFHQFMAWLVRDVSRFNDDQKIISVADLHVRAANGEQISSKEWRDAAVAAGDVAGDVAAGDAAYAAVAAGAAAYAGDAAYAAVAAGDVAAGDAAYAAVVAGADAYAARAAEEKIYQAQRDKLLELFGAAA